MSLLKRIAVLMLGLAGGCATFEEPPLSRDDPANPEAVEVPVGARSRTLDIAGADPVQSPQAEEHPGGAPTSGGHHTSREHGDHDMPGSQRESHESAAGSPRKAPPASPSATTATASPAGATSTYSCPMHPEVTSDRPGACPKCGMKLVEERRPSRDQSGGHEGHR